MCPVSAGDVDAKHAQMLLCDIDADSLCEVDDDCVDSNDARPLAAESSAKHCDEHEAFERLMRPFEPDAFSRNEDACGSTGEESDGESLRARVIQAPSRPSAAEVEEHMATHMPFRAWCPHCVKGKARGKRHARAKEGQHQMPTIAIDYMFMHGNQTDTE